MTRRTLYTDAAETLCSIGYDNDSTLDNTVNKLAACAKDRNDCYKYGDDENEFFENRSVCLFKRSDKTTINAVPYYIKKKIIYHDSASNTIQYYHMLYQSPMYFFQLIAATSVKINGVDLLGAYDFAVFFLADEYQSAHTSICAAGLAGIKHPHYPESYYLLSTKVNIYNFE